MSTKAKRHVHKYHIIPLNSYFVYACALRDCNHYMPKHLEHMIPGKATICWSCGKETTIDKNNSDMKEPMCLKCIKLLDAGQEIIPENPINPDKPETTARSFDEIQAEQTKQEEDKSIPDKYPINGTDAEKAAWMKKFFKE